MKLCRSVCKPPSCESNHSCGLSKSFLLPHRCAYVGPLHNSYIHICMYENQLIGEQKKPLRTYWSTDVLGRSPLQCHSCQRWTSSEVPEPSIAIEKQQNQAFLKTMPKVAKPTASKSAVRFCYTTCNKQLAGSILPCVFWNLWVVIEAKECAQLLLGAIGLW